MDGITGFAATILPILAAIWLVMRIVKGFQGNRKW